MEHTYRRVWLSSMDPSFMDCQPYCIIIKDLFYTDHCATARLLNVVKVGQDGGICGTCFEAITDRIYLK